MTDVSQAASAGANTAPSFKVGFFKLYVNDLEAMIEFYAQALGLVVTQSVETPTLREAFLNRPGDPRGAAIVVVRRKDGALVAVGDGYGPIGFYVRDVDAAYAWALAHGATSSHAPFDGEGIRAALVFDPEGRELELLSIRP